MVDPLLMISTASYDLPSSKIRKSDHELAVVEQKDTFAPCGLRYENPLSIPRKEIASRVSHPPRFGEYE
jgi:hypothetical protein